MSIIYPLDYAVTSHPLAYWGWQQKETICIDLLTEGLLAQNSQLWNLATYSLPANGLAGDPVAIGRALMIAPVNAPNLALRATDSIHVGASEVDYYDIWQPYLKGRQWARLPAGASVSWQTGVSHYWRVLRAQAAADDASVSFGINGLRVQIGESEAVLSRYSELYQAWQTYGRVQISRPREVEVYCIRAGDSVIVLIEGKGYVVEEVPAGVGGSFASAGYEVCVQVGPCLFATGAAKQTTFSANQWAYWLTDPTSIHYVGELPSSTNAFGFVGSDDNRFGLRTTDAYQTPVMYSVTLIAEGDLTRDTTATAINAETPEAEIALDLGYIRFKSPALTEAGAFSLTLEGGAVFRGICLDQPDAKQEQSSDKAWVRADSPLLLLGLKTCLFLRASLAGMDVDDALKLILRMGAIHPDTLEYMGTTAEELGAISTGLLYDLQADPDATLAAAWTRILDQLGLIAWWTGTAVRVQPAKFVRKSHTLTPLGGPVEQSAAGNPASLWMDEATGYVQRDHAIYTGDLPFSVHSPTADWTRSRELTITCAIDFDVLPADEMVWEEVTYRIERVHYYAARGLMEVSASA